MDYTKAIGNVNELKCLIKFISMGYDCSIPYGDAAKYDFIVDVDGKLLRIQCKSSVNPRLKNGEKDLDAFQFSCVSQTTNTRETVRHRYSQEDIDYFCTSFAGNIYMVPVTECSSSKTLRLVPPKNGNAYNDANDYLVEKILGGSSNLFLETKERYEASRNAISSKIVDNVELEGKKEQQFKIKHYCKVCGTEVSEKGCLCPKCAAEASRKVVRPTREELKNLIRTLPFTKIGEMYGVTDNSVRKWCSSYELPRRKDEILKIDDETWKSL
jgi:hypothetical protein